jgi:hypothetical protein
VQRCSLRALCARGRQLQGDSRLLPFLRSEALRDRHRPSGEGLSKHTTEHCADHIQQAAASGAEPEPGAQDGDERDVTDEEDAGSEEEDEEDQEAGIEQPIGRRTRQRTKVIGKGKERIEQTGQEVLERWDVDPAPISVRTRLKRKVLQEEQLYEAEKIVASKKKNGVSLLIIYVFRSNRNFFTRRGPYAEAFACIVH